MRCEIEIIVVYTINYIATLSLRRRQFTAVLVIFYQVDTHTHAPPPKLSLIDENLQTSDKDNENTLNVTVIVMIEITYLAHNNDH